MSIRKTIADYVSFQRTVRQLNSLDSRMLRDLGINRSEIREVARRTLAN